MGGCTYHEEKGHLLEREEAVLTEEKGHFVGTWESGGGIVPLPLSLLIYICIHYIAPLRCWEPQQFDAKITIR